MSEAAAPPGWYPDPWYPGMTRWFDGVVWTDHVAPAGMPFGLGDVYDPEKGATTAGWARWAFLTRGVATGLQSAIGPVFFSRVWTRFTDGFADPQSMPSYNGVDLSAYVAVSQLATLALYAALVFVCIWTYRATKNARLLGLRTTLSPGWAVAGWLIPFANYVMPWMAVRDLFPEGHPGRRSAGVWWITEIAGVVCSILAFALTLAIGSVGIVLGLAAGVLALSAGVLGSRLTGDVADVHQQVAGDRSRV